MELHRDHLSQQYPKQAEQEKQQAEQRAERLAERFRMLGIAPDS